MTRDRERLAKMEWRDDQAVRDSGAVDANGETSSEREPMMSARINWSCLNQRRYSGVPRGGATSSPVTNPCKSKPLRMARIWDRHCAKLRRVNLLICWMELGIATTGGMVSWRTTVAVASEEAVSVVGDMAEERSNQRKNGE